MSCCWGENFDLDSWVGLVLEDAIDPDLEIIDPHHHLYDCLHETRGDISLAAKATQCLSRSQKEWLLQVMFPKSGIDTFGVHNLVTDSYDSDMYFADTGGHNIVKSVCIEYQFSDPKVKDKALKQVKASKIAFSRSRKSSKGFPHAFSCHVDLRLGKEQVSKALKAHLEANPNVRGLRHQLAWHPNKTIFPFASSEDKIMSREDFRSGLSALGDFDLPFEVFVYHTQLPELIELVKAMPNISFILNHIGTPLGIGIYKQDKENVRIDWERDIELLAKQSNVVVKLSGALIPCTGIGEFAGKPEPPTSDQVLQALLPYFEFVFQHFGADRCMFASNFPVDKVSSSYVVLYNAYKKMADKFGLNAQDKKKVFYDNANRIYKLDTTE